MDLKLTPFLKFLDGEGSQVAKVKKVLPHATRLVQPLVGAGSIFLNTNYTNYLLTNSNADLINTYRMLAAYQDEFIERAKKYFMPEMNNVEAYNYYRFVFNEIELSRATLEKKLNKACIFVYLNRHGFKGMICYNHKREFNVPFVGSSSPYFPEREMLTFIDKINSTGLVEFRVADFQSTLATVTMNDSVYCNLPHMLATNTTYFNHYNQELTSKTQQELFDFCKVLKKTRGITSVISSHDKLQVIAKEQQAANVKFSASQDVEVRAL